MAPRFPVKARVHNGSIWLFDDWGYRLQMSPGHTIALPGDALTLGNEIARAVNDAFELGKEEARHEIRTALGITDPD